MGARRVASRRRRHHDPARSFGPALAAGEWDGFWIYVARPLTGAVMGAVAYQLLRGEHPHLAAQGGSP